MLSDQKIEGFFWKITNNLIILLIVGIMAKYILHDQKGEIFEKSSMI